MTDDEIAAYVRQLVDNAPPLTDEQRAQLGILIRAAWTYQNKAA